MRTKLKTNTLLYDTYDVKEGETPEMIAHKLYGDSELHFVIMLINDITDRYHEWPMYEQQFNTYVNEKYDNPDGVHHYEISQSSGDTTTTIEVYNNSALYTGDTDFYASATTITNREYEENLQNQYRQIRLLDPAFVGPFVEEYEKLIRRMQFSSYIENARYRICESYVFLSPKYFHEQTFTEKALLKLQEYIDDYPDSPKRLQAQNAIILIRNKLSRKVYESGRASWITYASGDNR